MSQPPYVNQQDRKPVRPSKYTAEQVSNIFKHVDQRLQELGERVLPKQPYLVSLPSDRPYRANIYDPHKWYAGTPFTPDEEQLQYMSFLPKDGEEEELLKAEGEWADESGNMLAWDSASQTDYTSRPNTPAENTSQRKKISLKDYQTKDKSGVNTPERRPVREDLRKEHFKSKVEMESAPGKKERISDRVRTPEVQVLSLKSVASGKQEKHTVDGTSPAIKPKIRDAPDSPRPAKRRKLSSDSSLSSDEQTSVGKEKARAEKSKPLPNLLSPTIPSRESRRQQGQLPDLLSPNLPPGLDKAVASAPPSQRTDEVKSLLKGIDSPIPSTEKKTGSSPLKDLPVDRLKPEPKSAVKGFADQISKLQSPLLRPVVKPDSKATTPVASPRPRQRHIIALKYGKKNRKRVEMLLKFKPKVKHVPSKNESNTSSVQPKPELQKQEKKRSNDLEPQQPAKKLKSSSTLEAPPKVERPSTPVNNALAKSPAASTSKIKSAFSTPKKEFKSAAMQRVASTDTNEARTPAGDAGKIATPLASNHIPKASPGPSLSSVKSEDKAAWTEMNEKYFQIGRTLKREGTKLAGDGSSSSNKDRPLSVVLLIEGLLCFMINSGAQSHARPNVDPGWSTIIPYQIMVFRQSRPFRHLHGLVVQLGAVCRQFVHNEDMKRLAREPLPDDQFNAAPTPGSDGTTKNNEDQERYKKKYLEFRDSLVQNARELQTAWLDGSRTLSLDLLEHEYPKTWKQRLKDTSKRHPDKINPKALSKDFSLPLDVTTNVFEATNFAVAFLKEWTHMENINWKPKIEL